MFKPAGTPGIVVNDPEVVRRSEAFELQHPLVVIEPAYLLQKIDQALKVSAPRIRGVPSGARVVPNAGRLENVPVDQGAF